MTRLMLVAAASALVIAGCGGDGPSTPTPDGGQNGASVTIRYASNPVTYTVGVPIAPNVPSVTNGASYLWSASPQLPPGLALNSGTGTITGTPTTAVAAGSYVITASDFNAPVAQATLGITVTAAPGGGGGGGGGGGTGTSTMTFTIQDACNDGRGLLVRFFDQTSNVVWPNATEAYVIAPGATGQYPLSCTTGHLVCYGAETDPRTNAYWGVGLFNDQSCSNCCSTCATGSRAPDRLACN